MGLIAYIQCSVKCCEAEKQRYGVAERVGHKEVWKHRCGGHRAAFCSRCMSESIAAPADDVIIARTVSVAFEQDVG